MADHLTLVYTERGLLLSSEPWDDWRAVQAAFDDYKASLSGHSVESVFEYLAFDYAVSELPFDRDMVEQFVGSGHGRCLWAKGDGWSVDCPRPQAMHVLDVFDVTGLGVVLALDHAISLDAPIGDHQVSATTPDGSAQTCLLRVQLVHFNPGGYRIEATAPYSERDDFPIGTIIRFL